jgi:D-arabinose 1-dehydrogenase-like Zn-dependent alcohol dehydrogenase
MCDNAAVNGATHDGGYAEYVLLRAEAVVPIPKSMNPSDIAPLLCAGVTVFNSMRKLHIEQGNLVAIQGLGGLGHLAVQYASKMGYKVAAISSSPDKRDFAKELGAHVYIDTSKEDAAEQLKDMGGAAAIITTAPSPKAVQGLTGGLQACGKLLVLAPVGNVEFNTVDLVLKGATVQGWPAGHALDVEETLAFSELHGVKAYVEKFPLDKVQDATDHMLSGKVRFRSVLEMN